MPRWVGDVSEALFGLGDDVRGLQLLQDGQARLLLREELLNVHGRGDFSKEDERLGVVKRARVDEVVQTAEQ